MATRIAMNVVDFDDEKWHTVIFEIRGDFVQIICDCMVLTSEPMGELDFSLLSHHQPAMWIMQSASTEKMVQGKVRQFKVRSTGSLFY